MFLKSGYQVHGRAVVSRQRFRTSVALDHTRNYVENSQPGSRGSRQCLSKIWAPTGGISATPDEDGHSKLIRAGFLRQAHSGVFHMLPLGKRVQDKIEKLVDKHMTGLGASRLDLSSISSQELWRKSGRLKKVNSELFLFEDRKKAGYLLSPTHEEEITTLVANSVKSYKELPVKLYQITRKFRDELRPRHGLLRGREFVMKDLYTFDINTELALETYHAVRKAYRALFDELKVPYLVADADSGDIGGDLSHEFHFPTPVGEDNIISCHSCDYVANEELAESHRQDPPSLSVEDYPTFLHPDQLGTPAPIPENSFTVWRGVSRDQTTLINVWYSVAPLVSGTDNTFISHAEVNTHAVKKVFPKLASGIENASSFWGLSSNNKGQTEIENKSKALPKILNLVDGQLPSNILETFLAAGQNLPIRPWDGTYKGDFTTSTMHQSPLDRQPLSLMRVKNNDKCPKCHSGSLKIDKAIELGHTFYLGTRYSEPLGATINIPSAQHSPSTTKSKNTEMTVPMQMGCHGIGVSRMIGAVAETLSDEKGLNWPRTIAPYDVVIVASKGETLEAAATEVYDELSNDGSSPSDPIDAIIDDRPYQFSWKMNDADLVGYPVIVVIGRAWKSGKRSCEVQCRRLGVRNPEVSFDSLRTCVNELLRQL